MKISPGGIDGMFIVDRVAHGDARGSFERIFGTEDFAKLGLDVSALQVNRSWTEAQGVVRGMHAQRPPDAETKIVTCTRGRVFDVTLDLRADSSTYMQWRGVELDAASHRSVVIPPGCAHGLQTLEPGCELIYIHDQGFRPDSEIRINPLDPEINISWPDPEVTMSTADAEASSAAAAALESITW